MRRKSLGGPLWVVIAALLLAACGSDDKESAGSADATVSAGTQGGTVIRHLESECKTLNWVLTTTASEDYVMRLLYDSLLDYDQNLNVIPVLAESYEVSDDHLRITVVLRDSLVWHDGQPITAEDIRFTVDTIRDPAIPAVNKAGWFTHLDRVEVVDDRTAIFVWSQPYAPAVHALTQLSPIPKHVYGKGDFKNHPANRAPVGSGAFKFEEWRTSQSITVARNDDYYRQPAYLDRVIFRVIPDQAVALNALKTGEIDEMRVRQEQWEKQTNDPDFLARYEKTYYYVPQYNYIAWNNRSVWFSDARVRRALTMLYDRQEIIDELYSGYSQLVTGPFYVNSAAYDKSVEAIQYDPDAARKLLDEAGWIDTDGDGLRDKDGIEFEFEFFLTAGSRISLSLAQLLQESCAKAGIKVNLRQIESATFFEDVFNGEYDAAVLAWRLDQDPDLFDTFHSSQVPPLGLNHGFYSNPEVDRLLEEARVEFDYDTRIALYHQVHRLIHDDQPYTFINAVPEKRPISKRIGNVALSPEGPFRFYPGAIYWYIKGDVIEARN